MLHTTKTHTHMQKILLLLIFVLFLCSAHAQTLKGTITTTSGQAIPYSTIYIQELTSGMVADENGKFQTKLNSGTYTFEFRSIGYEPEVRKINIASEITTIEITLTEKPVVLNELLVKPSKEDPAYRVIRHSIARAPFHLYQLSSYEATNYMKGSAKIESIPAVMKMMIKDQKLKALIGKLLVLESQSEVTFRSPEKYTQKVVAFKSSIPKEMTPKGGLRTSTSSIYQADFMGYISPLSPQAFKYYNFKLEDIYASGKYQVNKIRIIPKFKNDKLFSGFIYIPEDIWCVSAVDLTADEMGTITRYIINYQEVRPTVFLPITYQMKSTIGTMGVKGHASFYSSVKYGNIKLNESIKNVVDKQPEKHINLSSKTDLKVKQKIENITSKDKLTTKDAIQLSKLLNSIAEPAEVKKQRESLEIKEIQPVTVEVDSFAELRDSVFWENIRKVPLQKEEAASFLLKDSLSTPESVKTTSNSIEVSFSTSNKSTSWLLGGNIKLSEKVNLYYDGLLKGVLKEYNFADGWWLGQKLSLTVNTKKATNITISPSVYYTTARKTPVWEMNSNYDYAPASNGKFSLSFGDISADVQEKQGTSRYLNAVSSLFFGDNVIRFYQKQYIKAENSIDIANGLVLNGGASYEKRHLLNNLAEMHFFGNKPQPNYPDAAYLNSFPAHSASTGWLHLQYTPFYKYKLVGRKKQYISSDYPSFGLGVKKAFSLTNSSEQSSFSIVQFNINQSLKISEFNHLNYRVIAGTFLSKQKVFAPDYKYFSTSPLIVTSQPFDYTFQLLENYSFSTNRWLETHINWNSDYLLLKRIGFLQPKQFNESLHLHMLWNDEHPRTYIETGYSVGVGMFGRVGIFAGFDGFKNESIGVKVSLPLFR